MHEITPINNINQSFSSPSPWRILQTSHFPVWIGSLGFAVFLLLVLQVRIAPPDLAFYYSFAHSMVYDADFCFANEYQHFSFGHHETYLTSSGFPANDWPMGTGIAWIPFLLIARLVRWMAFGMGLSHPGDGFGWFDQWVVTLGATWLYSFGSLWITYRYCLLRGLSKSATLWATILMAVGSSYSYHLFINSADSHPPSAFFIILFLYLLQLSQTKPYSKSTLLTTSLLAGCSIGMAGLIRPHNLLFLLTPLIERIFEPKPASKPSLSMLQIGILTLTAGLIFFPQLIVWKTLYGSWLAIPRTEDILWTQPQLYNTLFSDFHGMISWSPLFGLGLLGLFLRRTGLPVVVPVLILLYIYSCNLAWWCGGSFGNRRMAGCAPFFILGLATLLETIPKSWLKIVAIICALWTFSLLSAEVGKTIQLDHYQSWKEILNGIYNGAFHGIYRLCTGGEWHKHTTARLVGFASVFLFFASVYRIARTSFFQRNNGLLSCLLILILGLHGISWIASFRSPQALSQADVSSYSKHDRFTWVVYYEKGFYLLGKHDYFEAFETLLAATIAEPRHPEPWMYMAYVCADVLGWSDHCYYFSYEALRYGKTTDYFLRFFEGIMTERIAAGLKPPEMLYNQRAIIRAIRKQEAGAREDFQKALSINPNYFIASGNLKLLDEAQASGQKRRTPFQWR